MKLSKKKKKSYKWYHYYSFLETDEGDDLCVDWWFNG